MRGLASLALSLSLSSSRSLCVFLVRFWQKFVKKSHMVFTNWANCSLAKRHVSWPAPPACRATCHPSSASVSSSWACAAPPCPYWRDYSDAVAAVDGIVAGDLLTGRVFKILKSLTFSKKLLFADNCFTLCTSFFSSSMSRFSLARLFWNHVITCGNCTRSVIDSKMISLSLSLSI